MRLSIHCDGGARGNPGPGAVGVVLTWVEDDAVKKHGFGKTVGHVTNNEAEYLAVIAALEFVKDIPNLPKENLEIDFFLDSRLVVSQIDGIFKIKKAHLQALLFQVKSLEKQVGGRIKYHLVPREKNSEADRFVNEALDKANSTSN